LRSSLQSFSLVCACRFHKQSMACWLLPDKKSPFPRTNPRRRVSLTRRCSPSSMAISRRRVSLTLAAEATAARGRPSASTTTWYFGPSLPRSVGFGPVNAAAFRVHAAAIYNHVPRVRRGLQIRARHADEDAMHTVQRGRRFHSSRQQHNVEPETRPLVACSPCHRTRARVTPARVKKRRVASTCSINVGGAPGLFCGSSIPSNNAGHQPQDRRSHPRFPVPLARETSQQSRHYLCASHIEFDVTSPRRAVLEVAPYSSSLSALARSRAISSR
jgi:hypothetical protein